MKNKEIKLNEWHYVKGPCEVLYPDYLAYIFDGPHDMGGMSKTKSYWSFFTPERKVIQSFGMVHCRNILDQTDMSKELFYFIVEEHRKAKEKWGDPVTFGCTAKEYEEIKKVDPKDERLEMRECALNCKSIIDSQIEFIQKPLSELVEMGREYCQEQIEHGLIVKAENELGDLDLVRQELQTNS
ncbi:MAG: hypothetical protein ACW99G_19580 [Candidatus Thorarchaeota archaeon]|jgi:hypothetical protein